MVARTRNASLVLQPQIKKTADYTVVINTDSGKIFSSVLDGMTYTLPAIGSGHVTTFINNAEDGEAAVNISPNANDGIDYVGSKTDDKDLINTKATQKKGDYVTIGSSDAGTGAWVVRAVRGIWAKES